MKTVIEQELSKQSETFEQSSLLETVAPQAMLGPQPQTGIMVQQSLLGNAALAGAGILPPPASYSNLLLSQATYGNAAIVQSATASTAGPVVATAEQSVAAGPVTDTSKESQTNKAVTAASPAPTTAEREVAHPANEIPAKAVAENKGAAVVPQSKAVVPESKSAPKGPTASAASKGSPEKTLPTASAAEESDEQKPQAKDEKGKAGSATTVRREEAAGAKPDSKGASATGTAAPPTNVKGAKGQQPKAQQIPALDTASSEGLLASLAQVPASSFPQALSEAKGAATQIHEREKTELNKSYPAIKRPTGLPRKDASKPGSTVLERGSAPEKQSPGPREGRPPETSHVEATGPIPGSAVSTQATEPDESGGGSWWDWLFDRVRNFLSGLPSADPSLSTSAGARPNVDITGEANPGQMLEQKQASSEVVATRRAEADAAAMGDFGENNIYPTVPDETLRPSYKPTSPPAAKGSSGAQLPVLDDETRAAYDENMGPQVSEKVGEQLEQQRRKKAVYQQQSQEIQNQGDVNIAEETARVRGEQLAMQHQARKDVNDERQQWQKENRKVQDEFATKSERHRDEVDRQIKAKVGKAETDSDKELANAEIKAQQKRIEEEAKIAAKKREAANQPRSFWSRVKGAVSDVFNAIKGVINSIIDGLRKAVKKIIETAKAIVHGIIELARSAVVGMIKAFGVVLKGFATIALAAFPGAAAKARAWIDKKVDSAVEAVNEAAEFLKKGTDRILDWVGEALDEALNIVQAGLNMALDFMEFLVTLGVDALELLDKLAEIVARIGPIIKRIKALIEDPTPVIKAIKEYIAELILKIPDLAFAAATKAITFSDPPKNHLEGIRDHLKPKITYLAGNWWEIIKDTAWTLIWPFAKDAKTGERPLFKDIEEMMKLMFSEIPGHIWHGRFSKAIDGILRIQQLATNVLGMFYGWIFIGLVIGGGILGAEAGVLPGMAAGAALALEIGQGLLYATLAIEGLILAKSGYNLVFRKQTPEENDEDYERIASSSLLLGVMGALAVLGAIAARFGKAIISAAGRFIRTVVATVLGPRAAALLEAVFNRLRAEVEAFLDRFRREGKYRLKSSGIGAGTYEGPASKLHPKRFAEILDDLERHGVDVNPVDHGDPWTGSYNPGNQGKPGTMKVHREVDIRTLEHEYQHFLDDKAKGYPGLRFYIENPAEMFEMERTAYNREIDLVKASTSLNAEEKAAIIKELEAALEKERVRYLSP